jgi:glycosyltransferase involved in cell wall biosynthesis
MERYGPFLNSIPSHVKVECLPDHAKIKEIIENPLHIGAKNFFKKGNIIQSLIMIYLLVISKITKERSRLYKYILRKDAKEKKEYDIAAAYAGPMDFISYYIANKIKAKKKIQWIHFDVAEIGFNQHFAAKIYKQFDRIFVVSKAGKELLAGMLPLFGEKIEVFPNIVSFDAVKKMAAQHQGFMDQFDGVRILTVGRLSKEKGQDLAIAVLAKLLEKGFHVRWYCIGDGTARTEYEQMIQSYRLEKDFILLGANPNPYPFMKQCDIYVQPSRHEGYCITLAEARCFDNPIIATHFTGADEQITDGETGLLIPFDEEQLFLAIARMISDHSLRINIRKNLQKEAVDHTAAINKLYQIANDL